MGGKRTNPQAYETATNMSESDSDFDDNEEDTLVDQSWKEFVDKESIREIVYEYLNEDYFLPWRIFRNNSDEHCLWSAASRLIFYGPNYSTENNDDGSPIILSKAHYETMKVRSITLSQSILYRYLTENEQLDLQEDFDEPHKGSMVTFCQEVLRACDMPTDKQHVMDFLSRLDFTNLVATST